MHHSYPVIEAAEVTILYNLRIEPLVEFSSRSKGAENRCSRTHHIPLLEIQKLLPDKFVVRSLFLTQGEEAYLYHQRIYHRRRNRQR